MNRSNNLSSTSGVSKTAKLKENKNKNNPLYNAVHKGQVKMY